MKTKAVCGTTPISVLSRQVYEYLAAKGYKPKGLNRVRKIWNHFTRYANDCPFTLEIGIAFLHDAYGIEWAEYPPPMKRYQRRSLSAVRYLRDYEQTGEIGIHRPMKPPYVWPEQFPYPVKLFLQYLDEAGYSKDYMRRAIREVHKFLVFLSDGNVQDIGDIGISHVMDYIHQAFPNLSISSIKTRIGDIRTFLKIIYINGLHESDLRSLIPPVRQFRLETLPHVWKRENVERLLSAIDKETPLGKRDYAIFLLAVQLGFRIGDILHLQFGNINWIDSVILISQTKTNELLSMPMSKEIGWAIIDYVQNGRPNTDSPYVFIRHCAPFQVFGINNNFHYQMSKYITLAGIEPPSDKHYGLHSLRHTFATQLLEAETPLPLISEFLGHMGSSATPMYLNVADEQLRLCALDPEIEVSDSE